MPIKMSCIRFASDLLREKFRFILMCVFLMIFEEAGNFSVVVFSAASLFENPGGWRGLPGPGFQI